MSEPDVLYAVRGSVAVVTLNRPNKLNAWTLSMGDLVADAMRRAEDDPAVRVILFTGAGRGFCAGADMELLGSIAGGEHEGGAPRDLFQGPNFNDAREDFRKTYTYFPAVRKPIVGAINGAAAGLGMVLALYCDIRIASEQARFSTAFARRGLISEHGISWILPKIVGLGHAMELLLSGRTIDAAEALRIGLVSQTLPAEGFAEAAIKYAAELATYSSPRSTAVIKRLVYNALFETLGEATDAANLEMIQSFLCQDFQEGIAHFLEKRPPAFTGQ